MALLDYEILNVSRPGTKHLVNGKAIDGIPSVFNTDGNVQPNPRNPKDQSLDWSSEGYEIHEVMGFYTKTYLCVNDIVTVPRLGKSYKIVWQVDWGAFTTTSVSHYYGIGLLVED